MITGSTSGIGFATARVLAREGANVMINGLGDPEEIEEVRRSIERDYSVNALYYPADMTKPAQIIGMIRVPSRNSGGRHPGEQCGHSARSAAVEEFPLEKWDTIIAINLSATFHAIRAVLRA